MSIAWSERALHVNMCTGSSLEHEQSVGDPAAPSSLAAFQRRAGLSHWLQVQLHDMHCLGCLAGMHYMATPLNLLAVFDKTR
jgi:hypothetical protein